MLSKFKEMEKRVANGEDLDEDAREYFFLKIGILFIGWLTQRTSKYARLICTKLQNSLKKKDTYFLLKSSLDLGHTADVANSILEYSVLIATFALLHS